MLSSIGVDSGARLTNVGCLAESLEEIIQHLEPLGDACVDVNDKKAIADILGAKEIEEVRRFYDRHPQVDGWYYRCYAEVSDKVNSVAAVEGSLGDILRLKVTTGCLVIVKDGPADGNWVSHGISVESLARTLWWYKKSGNDMAQVAGEREYARFIKSL